MFKFDGAMKFINIDQKYIKELHDVCPEVFYRPSGYESKPYIGILIEKNNRSYVIPLSSAKEKHKTSFDTPDEMKYKDLLNKEYAFCLKINGELIKKADKLYDSQMKTGKVKKFCCDFKKLEQVCDNYSV